MTPRWERHSRYQTEILPQVAAVLKLSPTTTAALVELDRRLAVEEEKLYAGVPDPESESVSREILKLRSAYGRAKTRILGGVDPSNRFEAALSDAENGTLTVLPKPAPAPSPDDPYTVSFRDYGDDGNGPNKYDSVFASVRGPSR